MNSLKLFFSLFLIVCCTLSGKAQYEAQSTMINMNIGWAFMKVSDTNNSVGGFEVGANLEQGIGQNFAMGFGVSLFKVTDSQIYYQTVPVALHGKYFFGSDMSKGFLKGIFGAQYSRRENDGINGTRKIQDMGIVLGVGIGLYQYLSDVVYIKPAY